MCVWLCVASFVHYPIYIIISLILIVLLHSMQFFCVRLSFIRVKIIYVPKITSGRTGLNSEINNKRGSERKKNKLFLEGEQDLK